MRPIKEDVIKFWTRFEESEEIEEIPSLCELLSAIDQQVFRHNLHTAMISLGESYARHS